MENINNDEQSRIAQAYQIARDMMHIDKFSAAQTKAALIDIGIDEQTASDITQAVQQELTEKERNKSSSKAATKFLLIPMLLIVGYFIVNFFSNNTYSDDPLTQHYLESSPYYSSPMEYFLPLALLLLAAVSLILRFRK